MILPLIAALAEGGEAVAAGTEAASAGEAMAGSSAGGMSESSNLTNRLGSIVQQLQTVTTRQGTLAGQLSTNIMQNMNQGAGLQQQTFSPGAGNQPNAANTFQQQAGSLFGSSTTGNMSGVPIPGMTKFLEHADSFISNALEPGQPFIAKTEEAARNQQMTALRTIDTPSNVWNDWMRRFGNWAIGGAAQQGVKPAS